MQRSCGYTGEFTGGRLYDSAHDYLWLFESEPPKARVAYQRRSRRSSEGWSSVKARVLVADKPTRRGALGSFLSACLPPFFLIHTHSLSRTNTPTHTHSMFPPLISPRNESPPLQPHNRFLPFSPLFISSQSFIWEMESEQLPTLTCCSSGDVYI